MEFDVGPAEKLTEEFEREVFESTRGEVTLCVRDGRLLMVTDDPRFAETCR